jgi:hypothetical protein
MEFASRRNLLAVTAGGSIDADFFPCHERFSCERHLLLYANDHIKEPARHEAIRMTETILLLHRAATGSAVGASTASKSISR